MPVVELRPCALCDDVWPPAELDPRTRLCPACREEILERQAAEASAPEPARDFEVCRQRAEERRRALLEKRQRDASQASEDQEPDADTAGDAIDDLVDELRGDSRPLTDYATLLSPTLISILRAKGITTVGHVVERWAEVPGIWGVGRVSLERLRTMLEEAAGVVATASAGAAEEDGAMPF